MATFILYQPLASILPVGTSIFGQSPIIIGTFSLASSKQSSKSQVQSASIGKADSVDFLELTMSHQLSGPMCNDLNDRSIRTARDRTSDTMCNDKVNPSKGADKDNNDIDYNSDTSDFPSLQEIFRQNEIRSRTRNNLNPNAILSLAPVDRTGADSGREGNSKEMITCLNAETVLSV